MKGLSRFLIPKSEGGGVLIFFQFFIFGLKYVAKNIEEDDQRFMLHIWVIAIFG